MSRPGRKAGRQATPREPSAEGAAQGYQGRQRDQIDTVPRESLEEAAASRPGRKAGRQDTPREPSAEGAAPLLEIFLISAHLRQL